ncbi:MAG: anti-sigma regulatory factor [Clostridia bacterium]|nr:anti-sigma regulatory factor [Clostridia bacterium]MBR4459822.1 anti-sigma regulatory factor [Clostridia bacterium]
MNALMTNTYPVTAADYTSAGRASADIKRKLKQLGVSGDVLRRVAVASYEVELNLVIHSLGGELSLSVYPDRVQLVSSDVGPGIPDLSLAMREGWSTANDEARSLGFGAGMGLPNMKRNADDFDIQSEVGKGTVITMGFRLA